MRQQAALASFSSRALAVLVDSIILLLVNLLVQPFFSNMFAQALCGLIISGAYYMHFLSGPWQATPGKRLVGIYVMHRSGQALRPRDALARFLAYTMPTLPLYSSMEPQAAQVMTMWLMIGWFAPALLTKERTAAHDMLCETRVMAGQAGDKS